MRKIGEVKLILNNKFVVIKTTEPIILGSEVMVYKEIEVNLPNLQYVSIPKGKLKVLLLQENNYYIASVITKKIALNNNENASVARSLNLYSLIFSQKENNDIPTVEGELSNYSAQLDTKDSLNISVDLQVKVGDSIALNFILGNNIMDTEIPKNSFK